MSRVKKNKIFIIALILSMVFLIAIMCFSTQKAQASNDRNYTFTGTVRCVKAADRCVERLNEADWRTDTVNDFKQMYIRLGNPDVAILMLDQPQQVTVMSVGGEDRTKTISSVQLSSTTNDNGSEYSKWIPYNGKHVKLNIDLQVWPSDGACGILYDVHAQNGKVIEDLDNKSQGNTSNNLNQQANNNNDQNNPLINNNEPQSMDIFGGIFKAFGDAFAGLFNMTFGLFGCSSAAPVQQGTNTTSSAPSSLNMSINQIDSANFPDVTLYTSVKDSANNSVTNLNPKDFKIIELDSKGNSYEAVCDSIEACKTSDEANVNLVVDKSGSMRENSKMSQAKTAAKQFVGEISKNNTSNLELTAFDDKVYNKQPFTNNTQLLNSSIDALSDGGETALYDALYWALQRTSLRNGIRFVLAFTDGEENDSTYTENEVIELSKKTGVPVYIIGVGNSINRSSLQHIASECKGKYYDCSTSNMSNTLSNIYSEVYNYHESSCKFKFKSQNADDLTSYRNITLECNGQNGNFSCSSTYSPKNDISLYDNKTVDNDYVLPDSNSRYYSEDELQKMSIWDLYLARNEIYARHGRGFKHRDLAEYFATKKWYSKQFEPEYFDATEAKYFNDYERKNADLMLKIEKSRNSPYLY